MEYHDQPLQFINNHFIQVKDQNAGEYLNITSLISSFAPFPLIGMPIVAYLTSHYIYPKICVFMEQYAEYLSLSLDSSSDKSTAHAYFLYASPGVFCLSIIFLLFGIHIISSLAFVEYSKETLHDDDLYLPYLHMACSWLATIGLFIICIAIAMYFYKKERGVKFGNHITALIVSLDVIYIICCFSPFMLLAFIHDPLVTSLTYCVNVLFIAFFIWLFILLIKDFEKHLVFLLESTRSHKFLLILTGIGLLISIAGSFGLLIWFVTVMITLGSFNDFQSLQTLLLSLLVALVSFSIVKPIYEQACKHVNIIKTASAEEEKGDLNIASDCPANKTVTIILRPEDSDVNNNKTEEMDINNKNDDDALV